MHQRAQNKKKIKGNPTKQSTLQIVCFQTEVAVTRTKSWKYS